MKFRRFMIGYWIFVFLGFLSGVICTVLSLFLPSRLTSDDGLLIGDMPVEFVVSILMIKLAIVLAVVGVFFTIACKYVKRRRQ